MSDGNKVLTLKDEGSPAPPPPDPPVPVTKKLKKLAVFASVTVGLFSAVFCCAGSALQQDRFSTRRMFRVDARRALRQSRGGMGDGGSRCLR